MVNQQGPIVQHMELCSVSCGSLDGRGVWGRMDTHICMAESSYCLPETDTTLLLGCTPLQKKKDFDTSLSTIDGSIDHPDRKLVRKHWI